MIDPVVTENARKTLEARYLIKNDQGEIIETPKQLYERVARAVSKSEPEYFEKFYNMMARCDFLPNTPCLMNAGKDEGTLFACFCLPIEDSMESIFQTLKDAATIHKWGGGTGFSFSNLRPKNSMVRGTHGVSSGPVPFMKAYNGATEAVKQGSRRRGANMGTLRVDHPDIMEFISCKEDTSQITNFNISVAITDEFLKAVEEDREYDLIDPHSGSRSGINARRVMDSLVSHAHATGEPGVIFIDLINRLSHSRDYETIVTTNPCGEVPIPSYDSCVLGSINLGNMLSEKPYKTDHDWSQFVDWDRLEIVTKLGTRFLDDTITESRYILPQIEKQTKSNRRIGLGIMGFADMLVRLGVPYNSERALEVANTIMSFIYDRSLEESKQLSEEKGVFPNWHKSEWQKQNIKLRNLTLLTIAPTGSICIMAGCSSGIEPHFAIAFEKNVLDGQKLIEVNVDFKDMCEKFGISGGKFEKLLEKVKQTRSISEIHDIPAEIRDVFKTTDDIPVEMHIRQQATFQKYCQQAVSKTINLPKSATKEDVERAYLLAYELGCKGVTVYRDGSRPNQVLDIRKPKINKENRPDSLVGVTEKMATGYGNLYVTINEKDGLPFEIFAHIGKSSHTITADAEGLSRMISLALRSGVPVQEIIGQLTNIGGAQPMLSAEGLIGSIPDAIAKCLTRRYPGGVIEIKDSLSCPCGGELVFQEGCHRCISCGASKCS